MSDRFLPEPTAAIAGSLPPSMEWWNFFQRLANANGLSAAKVDELIAQINAIDFGSLEALSDAQGVGIAVKIPGSWVFRHLNGSDGRIVVTTGDGVSSNPKFDLAIIADTGVGAALWKFTRDQWGRVEGTEAATTDDLAEGAANLYFTVERAQDAVGAALDGSGDVPLSYDDGTNTISAALSAAVLASLALADSALQPFAPFVGLGAGTPYVLPAAPAAVDMGTSDPVIVLDTPGVYLLRGFVQVDQAAGTVTNETLTVTFRRTNNGAADLPDGGLTFAPLPTTAVTYTVGVIPLPEVVYTTANSDDELTIFASLSAALAAGDLQISSAQIIAEKIG